MPNRLIFVFAFDLSYLTFLRSVQVSRQKVQVICQQFSDISFTCTLTEDFICLKVVKLSPTFLAIFDCDTYYCKVLHFGHNLQLKFAVLNQTLKWQILASMLMKHDLSMSIFQQLRHGVVVVLPHVDTVCLHNKGSRTGTLCLHTNGWNYRCL